MSAPRAYAVALLSGGALSLAFPEPDIAPLAWVCLVPVLLLLDGAPARRGFGLGFVFGIGFFGSLVIWVSLVGWASWAVLVALQSLFLGAWGAATAVLMGRFGVAGRVLAPAIVWVAVEYMRSIMPVGGFTWGQLAQSQHDVDWMLAAAGIAGGWGIALVVVAANSFLAEGVRAERQSAWGRVAVSAGGAAVMLAVTTIPTSAHADGASIRVALVQGNVPDMAPGFDKDIAIVQSHQELTEGLAGDDLDLVVWPESSVSLDPERVPEAADALTRAATAVDAPMVVGATLDRGFAQYLVTALEIAPDGSITDRYQKTHLVPFGEYVPYRDLLDWIPILDQVPRDAVAGDVPRVFDVAGGKVAPVISFEGDFGSLVRRRIDAGGRLLVVATNTSTWGESWASAQHLAFTQVRAAENGVWVVHAAISGISAFVAPDGDVVSRTALWTADTLTQEVRFADDITFYARTGDWLPIGCVILSVVGLSSAFLLRRRDNSAA